MRRVVYREIGGKRKRSTSSARRSATSGSNTGGFGRLLSQLFSASSTLERSRPRAGGRR